MNNCGTIFVEMNRSMKKNILFCQYILINAVFFCDVLKAQVNNSIGFANSPIGTVTHSTQVNGWTITKNSNLNTNSCAIPVCCEMNPIEAEILDVSNGYIDPVIGAIYPIHAVFGNSSAQQKILRLNNQIANYSIEKASKTITVGSNDDFIEFAFLYVTSTGHGCCNAPNLKFQVTEIPSQIILVNESFNLVGPSSQCSNTSAANCNQFYFKICGIGTDAGINSGDVFTPWFTIRIQLNNYIGKTLRFDIVAMDCTAGGHLGYTYIDAYSQVKGLTPSSSKYVKVGTRIKELSSQTVTIIESCTFPTTITVLGSFDGWTSGNNSSLSNSVQISNSGYFSFKTTMYDAECNKINQNWSFQLAFYGGPKIVSTNTLLCRGGLSVLGVSGESKFLWSTGDTTANIYVSPSVTTTYSATSTTDLGCSATSNITIEVQECLSINEIKTTPFNAIIFPNPNNGKFTLQIESLKTNLELQLHDVLGQKVMSLPITEMKTQIEDSWLINGFYFFTLLQGNHLLSNGTIHIQ